MPSAWANQLEEVREARFIPLDKEIILIAWQSLIVWLRCHFDIMLVKLTILLANPRSTPLAMSTSLSDSHLAFAVPLFHGKEGFDIRGQNSQLARSPADNYTLGMFPS